MRHCSRRAKGFSLVEALVGSAVLFLLTGSVYAVLQASSRHHQRVQAQLELLRHLMVARSALSSELGEAASSSLQVVSRPDAVIFGSPRSAANVLQFDSSGQLLWHKLVCFALEQRDGDTLALVRRERSLDTPASTPPAVTGLLPVDLRVEGGKRRVIARHIRQLKVVPGKVLELRLVAERTVQNKLFRLEVSTKIRTANSQS